MDEVGQGATAPQAVDPVTSRGPGTTRKRASRQALLTSDGVRIDAEHLPARTPGDLAFVVAHGFTGALERPAVRRAAQEFGRYGAVITFSFRGHGTSGGRSTVGDREQLDLDAAIAWARRLGYAKVVTVGFSMGGSVVLCQAGSGTGEPVDAVVSVSSPARWYYRGTAPMRRLHWAVLHPVGRVAARWGLRVRVHPEDWDPVPPSPTQAVPFIAPVPLLVVHGDRDAYFPLDHPHALAAAAGDGAELWIEAGFGHAENAAEPRLLHRIGAWVLARTGPGADPGRAAEPAGLRPRAPEASSWTARGPAEPAARALDS